MIMISDYIELLLPIIILASWYFYITRDGGDHDATVYNRWHRGYRRMVFWCGDIKLLSHFPYVTWDVHDHKIEYDEAMNALPLIRKGDIGLHRDEGYFSNLAIPGFMKHAWIHIDGPYITKTENRKCYDTTKMQIVEAVSEGVLQRHALYPIRSDYVIILRPKNVTKYDVEHAVKNAKNIVGCRYDASFDFDIEKELKLLGDADDHQELCRIKTNTKAEWDGGFSCTETASFCWWHKRKQLKLFRTWARGKQVILADQMINNGFEIIWMSNSITGDVAKSFGLGEEGLEMICEYRKKHPIIEPKIEG